MGFSGALKSFISFKFGCNVSNKKISICFIITGLGTGGAEKMLYNILSNIDSNRFTLNVISLTNLDTFKNKIEKIDVEVISLDIKLGFIGIYEIFNLFMLLKKIKPDIVHTWMYHADLIAGLISKLLGVKRIIWSLRQTNFPKNYNNYTTLLIVKLCAIFSFFVPNKILSCSRRGVCIHSSLGYDASKIIYIPNGFSLDIFKPNHSARLKMRNLLGIHLDVPVVGIIGRYDKQKNYLGFIASASKICSQLPNVKFVLVGKDVNYGNHELVDAIKKYNVIKSFCLLGERSDIHELVPLFDVLTLPSSYGEGFPNVIGEAMACEIPCVATDVGDTSDIIGDTGYVVPINDMDGLMSYIIKILTKSPNEKAILGVRARERIINNFDIKSITRKYEELYLRTLDEF